MTYLAAFAAALIPVAGGIAVNAWLRPAERRWPVLVGGGAALGLGLMVFAQMALLRVLPIQAAVIATYVLFGLIGAAGLIRLRRRRPEWGVGGAWTLAGLSVLALISVGAGADLAASVWHGSTHENLVVRMAMTGHIARGEWPVADPYSPDYVRLYRHAAQVWTASVMRISGADLFAATLATVIVAVWAIAGGLFAAGAVLRGYLGGLLGSAFFFMAGHANALGAWKTPFGALGPSRAHGLATVDRAIDQGFVLGHSFGLQPGNDFTVVVAAACGAGGAYLAAATPGADRRRLMIVGAAAICFASMAAAAEHLLPVVIAGVAAAAVVFLISGRVRSAGWMLAVAALSVGLSLIPEGVIPSLLLGTAEGSRAGFAMRPELAFTVPTSSMFYADTPSQFFAAPLHALRVPLSAPIALKELGWLYAAGLFGVGLIALRRRWYLAPFGAAAAAALLTPGFFVDQLYPINIAKFTSLAIALGGLFTGLVVAELAQLRLARAGAAPRLLGAAVAAPILATWVLGAALWPVKVYESPFPNAAEDLATAEYLRSMPYGQRLLLLPGPVDKEELNSDSWEGMHRFAAAFGTVYLPLGLDRWGNIEDYREPYKAAYTSLGPSALARLEIDFVYVAPGLLSGRQRSLLDAALSSAVLELVYVSPSGAREVYRVTEALTQ